MAQSQDNERRLLALGIAEDLIRGRADRDVDRPLVRFAEPLAELTTARARVLGIGRVADELPRERKRDRQRIRQVGHVQHLHGGDRRPESLLEGRGDADRCCAIGRPRDRDDDWPAPKLVA